MLTLFVLVITKWLVLYSVCVELFRYIFVDSVLAFYKLAKKKMNGPLFPLRHIFYQ